MESILEAQRLLSQFQNSFSLIQMDIDKKKNEHDAILKKTQTDQKIYDDIIDEKSELETILSKCNVGVCKYKINFEEIKKRHNKEIERLILHKKFHFFMCYRGDYYSKNKNVIELHQEIIKKNNFVWFAKFFKERNLGGEFKLLEPFGESLNVNNEAYLTKQLKNRVAERIENKFPIYLYLYNPNPPKVNLYVGNITDLFIDKEKVPYQDDENEKAPQCAFTPDYLFNVKSGSCDKCKIFDENKCKLKFRSNFWFKIDRLIKLEDIDSEFSNLINCFTDDTINFAVPILYPLIVTKKVEKKHFKEFVLPIANSETIKLDMPDHEKSHTRVDLVTHFFNALNLSCCNSFYKVIMIECKTKNLKKPKLKPTSSNSEILIRLPNVYRFDNLSILFKILLSRDTNFEQKIKVEQLIHDYIESN